MKTLFSIAATIAAVTAIPASANNMVVKYNDLDLSTEAGIETLDYRIASAAREMCGANEQQTGTRIASRAAKRCVADAKAAAKKQFAAVIEQQRKGG